MIWISDLSENESNYINEEFLRPNKNKNDNIYDSKITYVPKPIQIFMM